jgi:hypothetical protein
VLDRLNGDFTPFGYLRNPGHQATAWQATRGGNLLTSTQWVGMEWVYPVARDPQTRVGLGVEMTVDGRAYRTRADFAAWRLRSHHRTSLIFGFDWDVEGIQVEARYFLADDDALCLRLALETISLTARQVTLEVCGLVNDRVITRADSDAWVLAPAPDAHVVVGAAVALTADVAPGAGRRLSLVLSRGPSVEAALATGSKALQHAEAVYQKLLVEDAQFAAGCPTLTGDWPAGWREGLACDFESTRLLVQPAGGIFGDVWPSWMASWPRVVLAEGVLDMLRLAYADPSLAQRAVLSLFRDAPQPNVPCVFQGGEFNMVARDGSRCGTSPAWCLPFLNLELLYLRTLDRDWLGELYPYACAFLTWWLEHRVDAEGWIVYKCTWEAGEDGNPRLDPSETGDTDISGRVRPVELQATVAHAAGMLAFFAAELALPADMQHWQAIEATYRDRSRRLFDSSSGRYRDWLVAEQRFQEPCPERTYWGIDPCRESAQSLTPLLIGEPLASEEIWRHARPPWTLWPSWTLSLVESAAAAALFADVGRLAFETIDRVYRVTTRRGLDGIARPLPGCAPEFWPLDWGTYAGSDAYGWGATTANLLIRHLFGFKESRATDGWVAELTPALAHTQVGQRFGIRQLTYRGLMFDLSYTVRADALEAVLDLGQHSRPCVVKQRAPVAEPVYASQQAASRHEFRLELGGAYVMRLGS